MKELLQARPVSLPSDDSSLPDVQAAFSHSEKLNLRQSWLTRPEEQFRPASVSVGWKPGEFLIFAELEDDDIFSHAVGLNDDTWEKGDVLEMFLRNESRQEYQEFHIAPNNCKLQLRIPCLEELIDREKRHAVMADFQLSPEVFQGRVWIENGKWSVLARIPLGELQLPPEPLGEKISFSFSRYDHTRNREPMLSSTSNHRKVNFHRQQEWRSLVLYP